jgi:mannose-6-phosphate isomerase-like protein (cupin superfamily)
MKLIDIDDLSQPLLTETGEIIYELVGAAITPEVESGHSLARIIIPPGKSSSTHFHKKTEETYYILKGSGSMIVSGKEFSVTAGQACYLAPGDIHSIENRGENDLEFLAVCTPAWVPEDSYELE